MLSTCELSNPMKLWEKYKIHLSEDIALRYQSTALASDNTLYFNEAVKLIEEKVFSMVNKQLADFGMPTLQRMGQLSTDLIREFSYDIAALEAQLAETELQLLTEQKEIF